MFFQSFLEDLDFLYLQYLGLDDFYYEYEILQWDEELDQYIASTETVYLNRPSFCSGFTMNLYNDHTGFNIYNSVYKGLCESLRSFLSFDTSNLDYDRASALQEGFSDFFDYLINEAYHDAYYPPLYVQSGVTNGYVNYEFDYYMAFDTSVKSVNMTNGPVVI